MPRLAHVTAVYKALVLLFFIGAGGGAAFADSGRFEQAVSLAAQGRTAQAIEVFDALVSAEPQNLTYRLALARALIGEGQQDRAAHHLRLAKGSSTLSAEDRATLTTILSRLEGVKTYEAWLRLSVVPESNPGQRTSSQTVVFGGQRFTLSPQGLAKPATGLGVAFGGALTPHLREGLQARFGASIDARLFEEKDLTDIFLRGEAGFQGQTRQAVNWSAVLTSAQRWTGGERYGRALGLRLGAGRAIGNAAHLRLRVEAEKWRHERATGLDGWRRGLSGSYVHALRPDFLAYGNLYYQKTSAYLPWEGFSAIGGALGVQRSYRGGLILGLEFAVNRSRRDMVSPLFGVQRRDNRKGLTLKVLHREFALKGFAPMIELGLERQKSSISLYQYHNTRLAFSLSREF